MPKPSLPPMAESRIRIGSLTALRLFHTRAPKSGHAVEAVPEVTPLDVILRDGSTLRLRPPAAGEADAVAALFARLSQASSMRRFHGGAGAPSWLVRAALDPDWETRGALVGAYSGDGSEQLVALATFERLARPGCGGGRLRRRGRIPGPRGGNAPAGAARRTRGTCGHRSLRGRRGRREYGHASRLHRGRLPRDAAARGRRDQSRAALGRDARPTSTAETSATMSRSPRP